MAAWMSFEVGFCVGFTVMGMVGFYANRMWEDEDTARTRKERERCAKIAVECCESKDSWCGCHSILDKIINTP